MKKQSAASGFSLVELLVVVAIIVILLALLMPATRSMKQRANTAVCATNLRSLGTAMTSYASENDGMFPYRQDWSVENWRSWGWADARGPELLRKGQLWPYVRDESVFLCPTFERTFAFNPAAAHLTPVRSYTMNEYFTFKDGSGEMNKRAWQGQLNMIRTRIEKPAALGMISEENTWLTPYSRWIINNSCLGVGRWNGPAEGDGDMSNGASVDSIGSFHNPQNGDMREGSANVAFADGHVALHHVTETKIVMTPERIKQGRGGTD